MSTVHLGHADGRVTTALVPDSRPAGGAHLDITAPDGVWANHASGPGPAWVASDDTNLAAVLGAHYGCPVGRPEQEG